MGYEIFISYTNQDADRQAAQKIFEILDSKYFPVFWDKERLDAGVPWDGQLEETLKTSKHLVVVWSSKANNNSQWVHKEVAKFTEHNKNGLVFFVCLDIDNAAYSQYQSIVEIKNGAVYPDKINELALDIYDKVVNRIRRSIYKKEGSKGIKRAVFTLTQNRLQGLRNVDVEAIKNNYDEKFSDWKPFGSSRSIENILDQFLYVDINQKAKKNETLFHWEDVDWKEEDSRLWLESTDANIDIIDKEIKELGDNYNVLVLDPFALNDAIIKERFGWCYEQCYTNEKALIMSLSAFPLSSQFETLRKQLRRDANMFYNNCFNPPIINNTIITNAFAHLADGFEVKRQLQITLLSQISKGGGNVFTQAKF